MIVENKVDSFASVIYIKIIISFFFITEYVCETLPQIFCSLTIWLTFILRVRIASCETNMIIPVEKTSNK